MKLVFVCSPLRGNMKENIEKAKGYCKFVIEKGFLPIAPHVYFTQFLDDDKISDRALGMKMGMELLKLCDEMWVFGNIISKGMKPEIAYCKKEGKVVRYKIGI